MSDYDPTDLEQQAADSDLRSATAQLATESDDAGFVWLMSGPKGRRFVYRVLDRAGVLRTSWVPNALQMSMLEGQKQVGYWLFDMIQRLCPEGFNTMMQENRKNGRGTVAGHRSKLNN